MKFTENYYDVAIFIIISRLQSKVEKTKFFIVFSTFDRDPEIIMKWFPRHSNSRQIWQWVSYCSVLHLVNCSSFTSLLRMIQVMLVRANDFTFFPFGSFLQSVGNGNLCVTAIETKCQIVESVQNMSIYIVYIFCTLSIIWHFVSKTVTNNCLLLHPPVRRKTKMNRFF